MKPRIRLLLVALAPLLLAALPPFVLAQGRDRFSHATPAHKKKDCNSCHTNPTPNWVTARGFPDVADYPGHTSCNSCHSGRQFLALCSSCHTPGFSPRRAPRYTFPTPSHSSEFDTIFPHSVHQDVIAAVPQKREVAVAHFVNASYGRSVSDDPPKPEFNNCAICHKTQSVKITVGSRTPAGLQPLAGAQPDPFTAGTGYFKDKPSGHQSCFQCHFQGVQPTGVNCAGCHSLSTARAEPAILKRFSLKFDHQQKEHSVRDCMTCHVRISMNADLKTLVNADVPFTSCTQCHDDKITEEKTKRAETIEKGQPAFQCNYCHTTAIGRYPVPKSHENR